MNTFQKQFVGTWRLLSYSVTNLETGIASSVLGEDAQGHIIYTPEGWVSATLMARDRVHNSTDREARYSLKEKLLGGGIHDLTVEERNLALPFLLAAFGYIAYCGTFDADETHVHHYVNEAFFPAYVGKTATRAYSFEADRLSLKAEAFGGRDEVLWQRVPPKENSQ
ncbi:MAG: lipocalin-like domain-containing protein [Pseudomonadota bacterium]